MLEFYRIAEDKTMRKEIFENLKAEKMIIEENEPSEHLLLVLAMVEEERLSRWNDFPPPAVEVEGMENFSFSLLLVFKTLEVEGDDVFSKCLSKASLILFRSNGPAPPPPTISDLDDGPPRSLYIYVSIYSGS